MKKNKQPKLYLKDGQIPQLSIAPGIIAIAVTMAVVFAGLFIVLWRSDSMTLYFAGIFTSNPAASDDVSLSENGVRLDGTSAVVFSEEQFYTPDFSATVRNREGMVNLLQTIRCSRRYEQIFLVSRGAEAQETVTIRRNGEQYRIETADVLIVCDGNVVYRCRRIDGAVSFENRWNVADGNFSAENEIGIPTLEDIISGVEKSAGMPRMDFDDQRKTITLRDIEEDGLIRSVTLTCETGMLLNSCAETVTGETLYRCESVSYTIDPFFSEDTFKIPMP